MLTHSQLFIIIMSLSRFVPILVKRLCANHHHQRLPKCALNGKEQKNKKSCCSHKAIDYQSPQIVYVCRMIMCVRMYVCFKELYFPTRKGIEKKDDSKQTSNTNFTIMYILSFAPFLSHTQCLYIKFIRHMMLSGFPTTIWMYSSENQTQNVKRDGARVRKKSKIPSRCFSVSSVWRMFQLLSRQARRYIKLFFFSALCWVK